MVVNNHGGARKGAGRKCKNESGKAVTVAFSLSPAQREALRKAVAKSGKSQSEYILSKLF